MSRRGPLTTRLAIEVWANQHEPQDILDESNQRIIYSEVAHACSLARVQRMGLDQTNHSGTTP